MKHVTREQVAQVCLSVPDGVRTDQVAEVLEEWFKRFDKLLGPPLKVQKKRTTT